MSACTFYRGPVFDCQCAAPHWHWPGGMPLAALATAATVHGTYRGSCCLAGRVAGAHVKRAVGQSLWLPQLTILIQPDSKGTPTQKALQNRTRPNRYTVARNPLLLSQPGNATKDTGTGRHGGRLSCPSHDNGESSWRRRARRAPQHRAPRLLATAQHSAGHRRTCASSRRRCAR